MSLSTLIPLRGPRSASSAVHCEGRRESPLDLAPLSGFNVERMGKVTANGHTQRPLSAYESMVRALSDRLVEAQRPIRILDAIKWDEDIERAFFEKGCRELPPVTRDYYASRPLPFDVEQKLHDLH